MRTRIFRIVLEMKVDDIDHITAIDGPKQVIDNYIAAQAEGSGVEYDYKQKHKMHLFTAAMDVIIADFTEAVTKRNQIETNLSLLPPIRDLTYLYREEERNMNNVPE